jgi:hypothetical protein
MYDIETYFGRLLGVFGSAGATFLRLDAGFRLSPAESEVDVLKD